MKKLVTLALTILLLLPAGAHAQEIGLTLSNLDVQPVERDLKVDPDNPYLPAIQYLQKKGVVQGYGNREFKAERPITRAEFIKMLIQNTYEPGLVPHNRSETLTHPYQDVSADLWYAPYVQEAWELGILEKSNALEPGATLTRVQGAEWVLKLMGQPLPRVVKKEYWPLDFRDVGRKSTFAVVVLYGIKNRLFGPLEPEQKYFRPLRKLTRGEAANMLYQADLAILGTKILEGSAELEDQIRELGLAEPIPHLDLLADVWNRLKNEFYNPTLHEKGVGPELEQLTYDAIKGMVSALGDEYSQFFDPPESEEYTGLLQGSFGGIGAEIKEEPAGVLRIKNFLVGSPAESSGLRVNDRIVGVNGQDVRGKSSNEVVTLIRGEIGTPVEITVEREGSIQNLTYKVTRDKIQLDYLKAQIIEDALYVDINLFTQLAFIDFDDEVTPLIEENPNLKGFILDVRDNPGGYLESAKTILGHFIPERHSLLYVKRGKNHAELHISTGKGEWKDYPIVVLMNGESASAAEIMALALKEKAGAILVGETTFGKGTVQEIVNYTDGSSLKLTIAEWLSPKFKSINGTGIDPHVVVPITDEDYTAGRDPQLEKALEVLERELQQKALEKQAT